MKVFPLNDNVLIQPQKAEDKTQGGIIMPPTSKETPQMGIVVAVGEGKINPYLITEDKTFFQEPIKVKVGDKVMYKKWGGQEIKVDGVDMILVGANDILAIIEN